MRPGLTAEDALALARNVVLQAYGDYVPTTQDPGYFVFHSEGNKNMPEFSDIFLELMDIRRRWSRAHGVNDPIERAVTLRVEFGEE